MPNMYINIDIHFALRIFQTLLLFNLFTFFKSVQQELCATGFRYKR